MRTGRLICLGFRHFLSAHVIPVHAYHMLLSRPVMLASHRFSLPIRIWGLLPHTGGCIVSAFLLLSISFCRISLYFLLSFLYHTTQSTPCSSGMSSSRSRSQRKRGYVTCDAQQLRSSRYAAQIAVRICPGP